MPILETRRKVIVHRKAGVKKDAKYYIGQIEKLGLDKNYEPNSLYQAHEDFSKIIKKTDYGSDWNSNRELISLAKSTFEKMQKASSLCHNCEKQEATEIFRKTPVCLKCETKLEKEEKDFRGSNPCHSKKSNPKSIPHDIRLKMIRLDELEMLNENEITNKLQKELDDLSKEIEAYKLTKKSKSKISHRSGKELAWKEYKSLLGTYIYLEQPKHPFHNVKIQEHELKDKIYFTVFIGDGYKVISEKSFDDLGKAVTYAEKYYLSCSKK